MRVEALLGFARRVGALAVGSQAVTEAIRKEKPSCFCELGCQFSNMGKTSCFSCRKNIDIVRYGEKSNLEKF